MCPHGGSHSAVFFVTAHYSASSHSSCFYTPTQGEICLCTSRIYVERSIFKEFVERLVAAARKWKTGDPSDPNNNNGALISKEHLEKVANCQISLKIIIDWIYRALF